MAWRNKIQDGMEKWNPGWGGQIGSRMGWRREIQNRMKTWDAGQDGKGGDPGRDGGAG